MRTNFFVAAIICLLLAACTKDKKNLQPESDDTVTAVGTPIGQLAHKIIDANGGEVVSADGTLKLIIPANALATATDITIQPITNLLTSGIGQAYRLTPHGQQFSKPVTVVFNYKTQDTANSRAEFLDIAFQDADGSWQMLTNTTVDRMQKKITATTTHFSDWGYFKSITLTPSAATVEQEAFLELKVMTTFPRVDPDDAPPGTYTIPLLKTPRKLRDDEIKGWDYTGEGKLEPDGSWAFYTAPDHEPNINPEAVTAKINMHRKGQFLVISNITVLGGNGVDYLMVDEDDMSPLNGDKCMLYLYGNFGNDPGVGHRAVKINGVLSDVNLWSPKIIRCGISPHVFGAIEIFANNVVVASSVLRKFKGTFEYERFHGGLLNSGSSNALKETTKFTLVYRGFGKPCPTNVDVLFPIHRSLALGTEANYRLSGSATVTTPIVNGCASITSVTIPTGTGWYFLEQATIGGLTGFKCEVKDKEGGIEIKMWYVLDNIVTGVRVQRSSTCSPGVSLDPAKPLGVGLEGFSNKPIDLEFWGTDELKLKGTNELKSVLMSSGILIEAWDNTIGGGQSHYLVDGLMRATFRDLP
jgi:hypothetical protein